MERPSWSIDTMNSGDNEKQKKVTWSTINYELLVNFNHGDSNEINVLRDTLYKSGKIN